MSTEINYAELVGTLAADSNITEIPKKADYRIDDEGIIRKKKEMLTDAELGMMDAKAFGIYVFDQYLKNTKSKERMSKVEEAREFLMNNMKETPLKIMGVLPELGSDESGFYAKAKISGMELGIKGKETQELAIAEWNATARLMA